MGRAIRDRVMSHDSQQKGWRSNSAPHLPSIECHGDTILPVNLTRKSEKIPHQRILKQEAQMEGNLNGWAAAFRLSYKVQCTCMYMYNYIYLFVGNQRKSEWQEIDCGFWDNEIHLHFIPTAFPLSFLHLSSLPSSFLPSSLSPSPSLPLSTT